MAFPNHGAFKLSHWRVGRCGVEDPLAVATQPSLIGLTDVVDSPVGPNLVWQSRVGAYHCRPDLLRALEAVGDTAS